LTKSQKASQRDEMNNQKEKPERRIKKQQIHMRNKAEYIQTRNSHNQGQTIEGEPAIRKNQEHTGEISLHMPIEYGGRKKAHLGRLGQSGRQEHRVEGPVEPLADCLV
jgi:hypothetical protein